MNSIPRHVGLILDGNRRWAKARGLAALEGHRQGYENLKRIGDAATKAGVSYVSAYVFSTENWKRSKTEINYLMSLLAWVATEELEEFNKRGVRVRFAGSREGLSKKIIQYLDATEAKTAQNNRGEIILCFNYGGQQELADAVRTIVNEGVDAADITPETLNQHLYLPDVPPVDLIIRTSGEQRLSNFMLWRAAYSELIFSEKLWPDFSVQDFQQCLQEYARRARRFGK